MRQILPQVGHWGDWTVRYRSTRFWISNTNDLKLTQIDPVWVASAWLVPDLGRHQFGRTRMRAIDGNTLLAFAPEILGDEDARIWLATYKLGQEDYETDETNFEKLKFVMVVLQRTLHSS